MKKVFAKIHETFAILLHWICIYSSEVIIKIIKIFNLENGELPLEPVLSLYLEVYLLYIKAYKKLVTKNIASIRNLFFVFPLTNVFIIL